MAARVITFVILGVALFAVLLVLVYRSSRRSSPAPVRERDVAVRPSLWFADTRTVNSGAATEVGIVRVDGRTHDVVERRTLNRIDNSEPEYSRLLDEAQDRAYEAQKVANQGLRRR